MTTKRKTYTKIITDFFTKTPENIKFTKTTFQGKIIFLDLTF